MSLGENIKKARLKKGYSQKELAEKISTKNECFGNTAISNWENGTSKPDADTLFSLCTALDVDANYMLDWEKKVEAYDEEQQLMQALKENKYFNKDDDLSDEDLKKILDFAKANKDFIINKKD